MKELIKALHVIQDECKKHNGYQSCVECPMSTQDGICLIRDENPDEWRINDKPQKALL